MKSRRPSWSTLFLFAAAWSFFGNAPAAQTTPTRYDGQKLVRAYLESGADAQVVSAAGARLFGCNEGIGPVDYLVSAEELALLDASGISYQVLDGDVQASVDAEKQRLSSKFKTFSTSWFSEFKDYDAILGQMQTWAAERPDLVTLTDIGDSLEGRDLWMLRISGSGSSKPAVLLNGAQHPREWMSPMANMYVASQLIENYDSDPEIRSVVDELEIFILPVVNPDGYVYTWTTDRFWRKNRRPIGGGYCDGVDLNRNWGFGWGLDAGSSGDPCQETYRGSSPFSEPESTALGQFIASHPQLVAHVDIHAYGEMILTPSGYQSAHVSDHAHFMDLARGMHGEIFAERGSNYLYGPTHDTIYPVSGGMNDWCYEIRDILSVTVELPPGPGSFLEGFAPLPEEILPAGKENFRAMRHLFEWARQPLSVAYPEGLPSIVDAGVPTSLPVRVRPVASPVLAAGTAELHWRVEGSGPFTAASVASLGGHDFLATIPAASAGDVVEYYFRVESVDGDAVTSPLNAPLDVHRTSAYNVVQAWNMDTDPGWSTEGDWQYGQPTGQGGGPWQGNPDPTSGHTGAHVYGSNLNGNYTEYTDLVDHLTTDAIDCRGLTNTQLRFQRHLNISPFFVDHASVEVSNDGLEWTTAWQSAGQILDTEWVRQTVDISTVADDQPTVYVRWTLSIHGGGSGFSGWNLDDVELLADGPPVASWNNYGVGHHASLGSLPFLTAKDRPVRGQQVFVEFTNPWETQTPGWLLLGVAESQIPNVLGATLWLEPLSITSLVLPENGKLFAWNVPASAALDRLYLQVAALNPYVSGDVGFSQGLRLMMADQ